LGFEDVDTTGAIWGSENVMPLALEKQFAQFEAVFFVIYAQQSNLG
jgi:hypothetical protein